MRASLSEIFWFRTDRPESITNHNYFYPTIRSTLKPKITCTVLRNIYKCIWHDVCIEFAYGNNGNHHIINKIQTCWDSYNFVFVLLALRDEHVFEECTQNENPIMCCWIMPINRSFQPQTHINKCIWLICLCGVEFRNYVYWFLWL